MFLGRADGENFSVSPPRQAAALRVEVDDPLAFRERSVKRGRSFERGAHIRALAGAALDRLSREEVGNDARYQGSRAYALAHREAWRKRDGGAHDPSRGWRGSPGGVRLRGGSAGLCRLPVRGIGGGMGGEADLAGRAGLGALRALLGRERGGVGPAARSGREGGIGGAPSSRSRRFFGAAAGRRTLGSRKGLVRNRVAYSHLARG